MPVLAPVVTWLILVKEPKYIRLFGENIMHICIGFTIIFMVHKVPYHYFKAISKEVAQRKRTKTNDNSSLFQW
jgi:hypothetical protein